MVRNDYLREAAIPGGTYQAGHNGSLRLYVSMSSRVHEDGSGRGVIAPCRAGAPSAKVAAVSGFIN